MKGGEIVSFFSIVTAPWTWVAHGLELAGREADVCATEEKRLNQREVASERQTDIDRFQGHDGQISERRPRGTARAEVTARALSLDAGSVDVEGERGHQVWSPRCPTTSM
jgi:hypothetical protein